MATTIERRVIQGREPPLSETQPAEQRQRPPLGPLKTAGRLAVFPVRVKDGEIRVVVGVAPAE